MFVNLHFEVTCSILYRLVMEKESVVLYSCVQNTCYPQEKNVMGIEVDDWVSHMTCMESHMTCGRVVTWTQILCG